jgi:hypothetical protein
MAFNTDRAGNLAAYPPFPPIRARERFSRRGLGVVDGAAAPEAMTFAAAIFAKRSAFPSSGSGSPVPIRSIIHCNPTGHGRIRKV